VNNGGLLEIGLSGVFVAIGVMPDSNLLEGKAATTNHGYIITNEKMQTNIEGLFAAGDARDTPLRQVITAASDGAIAAYYASLYLAENK
jgi:thioredoxin reductase (NADPH)